MTLRGGSLALFTKLRMTALARRLHVRLGSTYWNVKVVEKDVPHNPFDPPCRHVEARLFTVSLKFSDEGEYRIHAGDKDISGMLLIDRTSSVNEYVHLLVNAMALENTEIS